MLVAMLVNEATVVMMPIVREFIDVFLGDLSGLSLNQEIKFGMDETPQLLLKPGRSPHASLRRCTTCTVA